MGCIYYTGGQDYRLYNNNEDLKFTKIKAEETNIKTAEDEKTSSPALKNIKKKLLTIRSWPNLLKKSSTIQFPTQ